MDDVLGVESNLGELSATYSVLTAESIFQRLKIHLNPEELSVVISKPESVYFKILLIPFKNIINGIILQQAYDYQIYLQKIFVDYFVSGAGNESETSPGANTRRDLEENRLKLVELCDFFEKDIYAHKLLIAESQSALKECVRKLSPIEDTPSKATEIEQTMAIFKDRANEICQILHNYRVEFKTLIVDTIRLIQLLPDYHEDEAQDDINRSSLQFDDQLI